MMTCLLLMLLLFRLSDIATNSVIEFPIAVSSCSNTASPSVTSNPRKYIWQNANFSDASVYLSSVDWFALCHNNPSALTYWNVFSDIVHTVIDLFVPSYTPVQYTNRSSRSQKPVVSKCMRVLLRSADCGK